MKEECDKTISKYIDTVSKTPEFGEGADDVILLQKHIISNQRNLITQLLIPNFPIADSVQIINMDEGRRPSIDSRYRSKSVASHVSIDEESDILPMNMKILTILQQYEEDLTTNFVRELEIRKEENQILHEQLEKKYPVIKPIEPNEIYKKRINELEIIIDQLRIENQELQNDKNYIITNTNHLLLFPFEEKSKYNNNNNFENSNNYILFDTLETIKNDLSLIHKELNRIIKMKNNYITTIESNKYDEYNKTISVVNELTSNNNNNNNNALPEKSPKRNKIFTESLKKCSELIRNVGDITSDYMKMKDKIKDEMREEMKEKYLIMNKQKSLQYKRLEEENNKLKEMLKLREDEMELIERENEMLKMMNEDKQSTIYNNINTTNNNNNNINTDYYFIKSKYDNKRKECLLKDVTIQYLKSIIDKQKQQSNLSNIQVVSLIQEFNQIKTQYEELLYSDFDDKIITTNNIFNSTISSSTPTTRKLFSSSFPPTITSTTSTNSNNNCLSPFSYSHLHNNNITPLCFHKSLTFDNNNNKNIFNFSSNTPRSCRSTSSDSIDISPLSPSIYTKWSKKISELEDLLEDKNDEINNLQLINVNNQNRINELELEYRNKEIISINLQNQLNFMIENENKHNTMKYNLGIVNYERIDYECKFFTLSSILLDDGNKNNHKNDYVDDDETSSTVITHDSERYKEDLDVKVYSNMTLFSSKPSSSINQLNDCQLERIRESVENYEENICIYEYWLKKMFVLVVSLIVIVIYI